MGITAKTYTTEAICLRSIDFGEADKILHLYSPDHGRISAIAKGVKKPNSKLAGACDLLNLSELQLAKGKSLDRLIQYQPRETFSGLRSDLMRLAYALLFAELVNLTATESDADSMAVYAQLKDMLAQLNQVEEPRVALLALRFQMRLLETLGYQPVLSQCVFTAEALDMQAVYYCFSPQLGGVTTPQRRKMHQHGSDGYTANWVNVSTGTLRLLSGSEAIIPSPEQVLKAQKFLQFYLKHILEREIRAFDLILTMLSAQSSDPIPSVTLCTP